MVAQLLKRRRGNPNWGRPIAPITGHAELQVKRLRLTAEDVRLIDNAARLVPAK